MTTTERVLTADKLWEMPENGRRFELLHGVLRPMSPANYEHGVLAVQIAGLLLAYTRPRDLGDVMTEVGFILTSPENTVLAPDVAFITRDRRPTEAVKRRYFSGFPDLAIEIVSPNDTWEYVDENVRDYLSAETRLVWIVNPKSRTVSVCRPSAAIVQLSDRDAVSGEQVIPGFSAPASVFF